MTSRDVARLDEVRSVLFGQERNAIHELSIQIDALAESSASGQEVAQLRAQLAQLQGDVSEVLARLDALNALVGVPDGRTTAVSEVLVGALEAEDSEIGTIGEVLKPEVEHALHVSARTDSVILAEALYPVMGPALRKMIAELFTPSSAKSMVLGSFQVDQVLLIERESGVLLAASPDSLETSDSDVVSGMLDAIRLFVEQAFDSEEHDGLRDLRVGDTSVLVEWGPDALLASVITGVPPATYRVAAAEALEGIHTSHGQALTSFDGRVESLVGARTELDALRSGAQPKAQFLRKRWPLVVLVALVLIVLLLVIVL